MMEPLVSVIIPIYNKELYILQCLESVEKQKYGHVEIIVVNDGSTDRSLNIINNFSANYNNIIILDQENLNAAMARNRGLEVCNGDYILFLDSDDILYENAIANMVKAAVDAKADLVIGNYNTVSEENEFVNECNIIKQNRRSSEPMEFIGMVPNPSNKLYARKVIDNNGIVWGNVRIGQDLNFFLKFLVCCQTVVAITDCIYGWRIVKGSISNSFDFRIFDITESFKDVKKFYRKAGKEKVYGKYVSVVEYRHYYLQMEKQKYFINRKTRSIVVDYFSIMMRQIDLSHCKISDRYKSDLKKCRCKMALKPFYISHMYAVLDAKFARKSKEGI